MKKSIFKGAATAIITPMKNGEVDFDALGRLVDYQIENGIDALVAAGTTGESSTLTDEEHVEVIKTVVDRAAGRVPVIAGTGSNDAAYAVKLSQDACRIGADALLLVTPYYNKATQAGLIAMYKEIAANVDRPIILYNVPSRTGVNIEPSTYAALAEVPNVVGLMKDDALTVLGKFVDIDVIEVENSDTPGGEVMSQSIEAGTYADPDMPLTITISKEEEPVPAADTAAAADGTWKSNNILNTPDGYQGGEARLELVQEVGGQQTVTVIAEGSEVQFPYQLDLTGLPGVQEGTVYIYEMIDGSYQMLGKYTITFSKVD